MNMDILFITLMIGILIIVCFIFRRWFLFGKKQNLSRLSSPQEINKEIIDNKPKGKEQILNALVNERLYLNKNLTLSMLAKSVQMTRHSVSQIINREFQMNFYQLVNQYRVKEFENLLLRIGNLEKANIKELSKQAGFKTFSSFNNYFKQIKGMTPGEYKKSLRLPSLFQDENI